MIELATGRDLTESELLRLVRGLAARPRAWQHLVEHDPEQRRYEELVRADHVSIWLICWSEDQDTGFHDHDLSAGAVAVVAGQVREERLTLGGPPRTRIATAGEDFTFSAADIHRVSHAPGEPAVTTTPTRRRCGTWAPTRSCPTAACGATPGPTPGNCGRSDHGAVSRPLPSSTHAAPDASGARWPELHAAILDTVLAGGDLERVAALAAEDIVPPAGLAVAWPTRGEGFPAALRRYASQRLDGEPAPVPERLELELPVVAGGAELGAARRWDARTSAVRGAGTSRGQPHPPSPAWAPGERSSPWPPATCSSSPRCRTRPTAIVFEPEEGSPKRTRRPGSVRAQEPASGAPSHPRAQQLLPNCYLSGP